jgi:hypothetical protein
MDLAMRGGAFHFKAANLQNAYVGNVRPHFWQNLTQLLATKARNSPTSVHPYQLECLQEGNESNPLWKTPLARETYDEILHSRTGNETPQDWSHDKCPLCLSPNEMVAHVISCRDPQARLQWTCSLDLLGGWSKEGLTRFAYYCKAVANNYVVKHLKKVDVKYKEAKQAEVSKEEEERKKKREETREN